jgi:hypothetical protein
MLADPARARQMGAAARARINERFNPEQLNLQIVAAWRKCAGIMRQ